jgi:bacterioferritin-associated ferredoxin
MYACVCNALTERDVRDAISRGAKSVGQIFALSNSRPECGICSCHMRDMIRGWNLVSEERTATSATALESGRSESLGLVSEPA